MSYTRIPDIDISSKFGDKNGKINKVVWFSVSDTQGIYNVNLLINPNQKRDTNITIFNKETKQTVWNKIYPASSTTTQIVDQPQINHIPGLMSPYYGIKIN
jgi:hypothetical protein